MIKQSEVDDACNALRAAREIPTLEKVRALLKNGGSNRDVGPKLKDWKERNDIPDWQVDLGPSSDVVAKFDSAAAAIWEAGRSREAAAFGAERAHLEDKASVAERRLADALAKLDDTERRLREQIIANRVMKREMKGAGVAQRRRAEEFWDRVMRTVGEVLQAHGPQFPKDILKLLPDDLFREATHHAEKLTLGTLNKKLDMRDTYKRYVESDVKGADEMGKWRAVAA